MKILITSGATREPIDDVRFLTNVSTGGTGAALAEGLEQAGHQVTLLRGEGAVNTTRVSQSLTFSSTEDLLAQLQTLLGAGDFGAVIQCAAVSDYRPAEAHHGKLSSYSDELVLRLVPTPKILPRLKAFSPTSLRVIGFKLTSGADENERDQAVGKVLRHGSVDHVIHNDLHEMATAGSARMFRVYSPDSTSPECLKGIDELTAWLALLLH